METLIWAAIATLKFLGIGILVSGVSCIIVAAIIGSVIVAKKYMNPFIGPIFIAIMTYIIFGVIIYLAKLIGVI